MQITILTFDQFNELDSLVALNILNRVKKSNWKVTIASPTEYVSSMNGVVIKATSSLADVNMADVVLIGSGTKTREIVLDQEIMNTLKLDPSRQLIGAQCSGTLILSKLGLLNDIPACTDITTKPWVIEAGVSVLNQPFFAKENIATAGGCLSSMYLAAWVIARLEGLDKAKEVINYVAPVGEKELFVSQVLKNIGHYLESS
ncbi:Isonitrile hydratase [Acinetobacter oleivorans]|uniref:DJ-1/PfpI family protein n=1 Tax=Acinetobacter calcoaceticus/baumannii complex TaxID=909768 RepID=UPI0021EFFA70|nr:DJ-1/PfpI family protein [Acinetobacter pittii]CAI3100258.1 Isonitrile hydratase [Acinetobacter oleivorans]MEB6624890.1 DJ-1/PfpI family protein [Acinetobacter pittii]CAI3100315.1 Isonitrile hydratase [Acinetobacter oleivorans]CAI3118177.1 Isonitrile hydratase [Acinetobacter oleivorans]CAI3118224.1 Isonitrile hydratase [Acinetobacter oleivorans]